MSNSWPFGGSLFVPLCKFQIFSLSLVMTFHKVVFSLFLLCTNGFFELWEIIFHYFGGNFPSFIYFFSLSLFSPFGLFLLYLLLQFHISLKQIYTVYYQYILHITT